jgi:signal peptidase I
MNSLLSGLLILLLSIVYVVIANIMNIPPNYLYILFLIFLIALRFKSTGKKLTILTSFGYLFLSSIFIRTFVQRAVYMTSGGMLPALQINDRFFVDTLQYKFQSIKRGDVIAFNPTQELEKQNFHTAFISRVIGLPNETIEVRGGGVYINKNLLQEPYQDRDNAPKYEYGPVTLPQGQYFVLGDNRNNRNGSHHWGFVPKDKVIGRARSRFWPVDRRGLIE